MASACGVFATRALPAQASEYGGPLSLSIYQGIELRTIRICSTSNQDTKAKLLVKSAWTKLRPNRFRDGFGAKLACKETLIILWPDGPTG